MYNSKNHIGKNNFTNFTNKDYEKVINDTQKLSIDKLEQIKQDSLNIRELGNTVLTEIENQTDQLKTIDNELDNLNSKQNTTIKLQNSFDKWNGNFISSFKNISFTNFSNSIPFNNNTNYNVNSNINNNNFISDNKKINVNNKKINNDAKLSEEEKRILENVNKNNKIIDEQIDDINDIMDDLANMGKNIKEQIIIQNNMCDVIDNKVMISNNNQLNNNKRLINQKRNV